MSEGEDESFQFCTFIISWCSIYARVTKDYLIKAIKGKLVKIHYNSYAENMNHYEV